MQRAGQPAPTLSSLYRAATRAAPYVIISSSDSWLLYSDYCIYLIRRINSEIFPSGKNNYPYALVFLIYYFCKRKHYVQNRWSYIWKRRPETHISSGYAGAYTGHSHHQDEPEQSADILSLASKVYSGLTPEDITEIEILSLDRKSLLRDWSRLMYSPLSSIPTSSQNFSKEWISQSKGSGIIREHGRLTISHITKYEILKGLKSKKADKQIEAFNIFCASNGVLPITDEVIIKRQTSMLTSGKKGSIISDADILGCRYRHNQTISPLFRIISITFRIAGWNSITEINKPLYLHHPVPRSKRYLFHENLVPPFHVSWNLTVS